MPFALEKLIDKAHSEKTFEEICELPVAVLRGVTDKDAMLLEKAFGITTVEDLGTNPYFMNALNIFRATMDKTYDSGPPAFWVKKFAKLSDDYFVNHPSERFRTSFGGVLYRGRLDNTARLLIIGQDPSTDEAIARRAFVGSAGQRLQKFLSKIGITRSYTIINTFAYSIKGQFNNEMRNISLEAPLKEFREELMDTIIAKNPIQAILTFGAGARHAVENWENREEIPVFHLVHPTAPEGTTHPNWNDMLPQIADFVIPDDPSIVDTSPYDGSWNNEIHAIDIPRFDLPYDIPFWHGTGGTRSRRDPADRVKNIIWQSP